MNRVTMESVSIDITGNNGQILFGYHHHSFKRICIFESFGTLSQDILACPLSFSSNQYVCLSFHLIIFKMPYFPNIRSIIC